MKIVQRIQILFERHLVDSSIILDHTYDLIIICAINNCIKQFSFVSIKNSIISSFTSSQSIVKLFELSSNFARSNFAIFLAKTQANSMSSSLVVRKRTLDKDSIMRSTFNVVNNFRIQKVDDEFVSIASQSSSSSQTLLELLRSTRSLINIDLTHRAQSQRSTKKRSRTCCTVKDL